MNRSPARISRRRVTCARAVLPLTALLLLRVPAANAANPWQLTCALTPAEQALPVPVRAAASRFFPWVWPVTKGLRAGPIYLVALSSRSAISRDGDGTDGSGYYLHRALIAIAPSYPASLTISGRRLGHSRRRTTLGFSVDGATNCTTTAQPDVRCGSRPLRFATTLKLQSHTGWRIIPTELRIGRTGCFRITATGPRLHETIPLAVPGPDFGTAGW
jgi:hypothetical protein